jgi:hypothetical protein
VCVCVCAWGCVQGDRQGGCAWQALRMQASPSPLCQPFACCMAWLAPRRSWACGMRMCAHVQGARVTSSTRWQPMPRSKADASPLQSMLPVNQSVGAVPDSRSRMRHPPGCTLVCCGWRELISLSSLWCFLGEFGRKSTFVSPLLSERVFEYILRPGELTPA